MDGGVLADCVFDLWLVLGLRCSRIETSAVDVFGLHLVCESGGRESGAVRKYGKRMRPSAYKIRVGPRQNVVISRIKILVQLESLILAQSERWRQA